MDLSKRPSQYLARLARRVDHVETQIPGQLDSLGPREAHYHFGFR